jgi:thiol-disulfide isomerase/thioredoxin
MVNKWSLNLPLIKNLYLCFKNYKIMKTIITFVLLFLSITPFAQNLNRRITDEKAEGEILIGVCNKNGLAEAPYSDWFNTEYNNYNLDTRATVLLKQYSKNLKVSVVFGTWCSDSRREVPRFYKLADNIGIIPENIKLLAVDSKKTGGDVDISGLKIEKVPTFIFFISDKEIGRIVETPEVNIETNLLKILQQK